MTCPSFDVCGQASAGPLHVARPTLCQRHLGGSVLPSQGRLRPCWPQTTQHPLECRWRVLQAHRLWPQLQTGKPGWCWCWTNRNCPNWDCDYFSLFLLGCQVHPDRRVPCSRSRASEQPGPGWGRGRLGLHSCCGSLESRRGPVGDVLRSQTQRHYLLAGVEGMTALPRASKLLKIL